MTLVHQRSRTLEISEVKGICCTTLGRVSECLDGGWRSSWLLSCERWLQNTQYSQQASNFFQFEPLVQHYDYKRSTVRTCLIHQLKSSRLFLPSDLTGKWNLLLALTNEQRERTWFRENHWDHFEVGKWTLSRKLHRDVMSVKWVNICRMQRIEPRT